MFKKRVCSTCIFYQYSMIHLLQLIKKRPISKTPVKRKQKQSDLPVVRISHKVCKEIMLTVGKRPPESGGILLGPVGTNDITDFFFDSGGTCTNATYSPDCKTLKHIMKEQWLPANLDMKGFVHSHPGSFDCLSAGDLVYIGRLLEINDDMPFFTTPVVIPSEFRLSPLVVLRDNPKIAREARFEYF
ncbi:MAG: hypothetical protein JXR78_14195 [Victivallales bacterium]|nr:hypothetical protein [Victivallales bacterium]